MYNLYHGHLSWIRLSCLPLFPSPHLPSLLASAAAATKTHNLCGCCCDTNKNNLPSFRAELPPTTPLFCPRPLISWTQLRSSGWLVCFGLGLEQTCWEFSACCKNIIFHEVFAPYCKTSLCIHTIQTHTLTCTCIYWRPVCVCVREKLNKFRAINHAAYFSSYEMWKTLVLDGLRHGIT